MRTSKFTPEQMVQILRQGDGGVPVVELCRQHGISEQTYLPVEEAVRRPGHR
jgi:putative transposase